MAGILNILMMILITSGLIGVKCQTSECTQPNYDRCVKDLKPLVDAAEPFYIKYTIDRMRELCSEYRSTKSCIQQFEQNCDSGTKNDLQSTHAFYEYICDNTFSVFVKYRDCLVKPELEARAHSCNSTFFQSVTTATTRSHCGHLKAFIDCLSTEVRIECGQEAAQWQLGLDKATTEPITSPRCSLDRDSQTYCTNENVDKCFAPLVQHRIEKGNLIVPTHTAEDIVALCKSYTEVRPCIDLLIDECHPHDERVLRSNHDSYKYICDDHLNEYLEHRDCLATPKLQSEGKLCKSSIPDICQRVNTQVDCIENLVESFCGRDAATWQRGLNVAVYKPLLECKIPSTTSGSGRNSSTGSIRSAVISAILISVVIIAMIAA